MAFQKVAFLHDKIMAVVLVVLLMDDDPPFPLPAAPPMIDHQPGSGMPAR
jgi:hypothetical protein